MSQSSPNSVADFVSPHSRLSTLPPGYPQFTLGEGVAAWAQEWLIQPNGPRAGKPFRLTYDQYRFLLWFYAVDDEGRWLFDGGVRRLAKGSGKSPFAAVMALAEFCGPVRFDRFDDRRPGGCRGKPVEMPLVQIAATAKSQTANTMRMVRAFAPKGSPVVEHYWLDPGKTQYYRLPEGTLEVITSSVTAAEGAEASFVVGDETEHWKPANSGPELSATLEDNLAKSGSRMLKTCNAWVPGIGSVAEADWNAWVEQEEGLLQRETRLLYDARIAPPDTNMADPESLRTALEWVYGDCDWKKPDPDAPPNVRSIMQRIWAPQAKPSESARKYLNRPTVAEDAWTAPAAWALLANPARRVTLEEEVVLFFDGSKSRDATALVGCCMSDGHVFVVDIWEPDTAHNTDDVVPVVEVDATVTRAFATLNVVGFFGDVKEWESFVKVDWPTRFGDRCRVWAQKDGKDPQPIAWDMRGHVLDFTRACELVEAEIVADPVGFTHDDDPRLARHVANCRRRPNRWGVSIGKESPDSPLKIDGAVCMIGARMLRRLVLAVPVPKNKAGSIWGG